MFRCSFRHPTRSPLRRRTAASRGLALVEQIVAVAALGVVSAVALPKVVELQAASDATALKSLAATASTAMVANLGACLVTQHRPVAGGCQPVSNCQDLTALLYGALPAGFSVENQVLGATGTESVCTLVNEAGGQRHGFVGLSAGH